MDKLDKYLRESKEQDFVKSLDKNEIKHVRETFKEAYDYLDDLSFSMEAWNEDSKGLFGKDMKLALQAFNAIKKMTLGKYI
jgi:hypothetical protein